MLGHGTQPGKPCSEAQRHNGTARCRSQTEARAQLCPPPVPRSGSPLTFCYLMPHRLPQRREQRLGLRAVHEGRGRERSGRRSGLAAERAGEAAEEAQ